MSAMPCPAEKIHTPRRSTAWRAAFVGGPGRSGASSFCAVAAGGTAQPTAISSSFRGGVGDGGEQVVDHDGFGLADASVVECGPQ